MDSVTQAVLGACVVTACLHKENPAQTNLLLALGAITGTLPDLDVFVPFGDPVSDFVHHRGPTHSLFVQFFATPLLAEAVLRLLKRWRGITLHRTRLWIALYLGLLTHALLDAFTVYGTQIFWPLPTHPESWSTLFIIDPLYTLPLIFAVVAAVALSSEKAKIRAVWAGLALSSAYLGWSVVAKAIVEHKLREVWEQAGITPDAVVTTPSPFNTILWRAVALTKTGYAETYYSLLANKEASPSIRHIHQDTSLLDLHGHMESMRKLRWFTKDFLKVSKDEREHLIVSDLRMGAEPNYIFTFDLGKVTANPSASRKSTTLPESTALRDRPNSWSAPGQSSPPVRVRDVPREIDLGLLLRRFWTH